RGRYTVKADRMIFFAKREASRLGSPTVETEHLLLVILREERAHFKVFLPLAESREAICTEIEKRISIRESGISSEGVATSVNLPLSDECRRAQTYADEEATLLGSQRISPEHLLLGLLREEGSFAGRVLREHGADLARIRRELTVAL